MSWYKVSLSNAEVAGGKYTELFDAIDAALMSAGDLPSDAGMFDAEDVMASISFQ